MQNELVKMLCDRKRKQVEPRARAAKKPNAAAKTQKDETAAAAKKQKDEATAAAKKQKDEAAAAKKRKTLEGALHRITAKKQKTLEDLKRADETEKALKQALGDQAS